MAEITFTVEGADQVIANLGQVTPNVRKQVGDTMRRLQVSLVNSIRAAFSAVGLHSRSGALLGSVQPGEVAESDSEITAAVHVGGGEAFYARAQAYGVTISAKNVTYLTIPLDAAKTAMGVGRWSARQIIEDPSIGGYTGTFFRHGMLFGIAGKKTRGRSRLGAQSSQVGKVTAVSTGGEITVVPLFVLRPTVTLPERDFVRPPLTAMLPQIQSELQAAVNEGARG